MSIKRIYNLKPTPKDHSFHPTKLKVSVPCLTPLPPLVDLRDSGLLDPVYDQGSLGSCSGNAFAGAYNYELRFQGLAPLTPNPSRLFLYYAEREIEGTVNQDSGAMLGDGCKALNQSGICSEKIWGYDIDKFTVKPINEAYTEAANHKLLQFNAVHDLNDIKHSLANKKPVVMGIMLYASFETNDVATTGIVPMPDTNMEECLGGHAVLCVGYNDSKQWLVVRNSWSMAWGSGGYFYLPYTYITNGLYMEGYTLEMVK